MPKGEVRCEGKDAEVKTNLSVCMQTEAAPSGKVLEGQAGSWQVWNAVGKGPNGRATYAITLRHAIMGVMPKR